ncbi:hypothetical protein FGG08_000316 [Glutinoglossum americanum]|uniref:Uncharacterized protein n=1 Tax=Glutinoglossum americanum TaxID=1670608 RepID=A0A9P8L6Z7_9PEZI|nr:hypothetical protein FGG08_000316 [Glutinoglossum americanum]
MDANILHEYQHNLSSLPFRKCRFKGVRSVVHFASTEATIAKTGDSIPTVPPVTTTPHDIEYVIGSCVRHSSPRSPRKHYKGARSNLKRACVTTRRGMSEDNKKDKKVILPWSVKVCSKPGRKRRPENTKFLEDSDRIRAAAVFHHYTHQFIGFLCSDLSVVSWSNTSLLNIDHSG